MKPEFEVVSQAVPKFTPKEPSQLKPGRTSQECTALLDVAVVSPGLPGFPHQGLSAPSLTFSVSPLLVFYFVMLTLGWLLTTWFCFPC